MLSFRPWYFQVFNRTAPRPLMARRAIGKTVGECEFSTRFGGLNIRQETLRRTVFRSRNPRPAVCSRKTQRGLKKEDHNKVHVPEESLGIRTLASSCQERGLLCEDHHQQMYRRHEDKRDLWLKTTYIRNMAAFRRNKNGAKNSAENHIRNLHICGRKKTPSQISRTILRHSTLTSRPPRNRFSRVTNRGMAFPKG
jgi:hypothetical protein